MKKWILSAALLLAAGGLQAQEVFDTLLEKASQVVNTNDVNDYNTKINYFYFTALNYMKTQARPQDAAQYKVLDEQALAMYKNIMNKYPNYAFVRDVLYPRAQKAMREKK